MVEAIKSEFSTIQLFFLMYRRNLMAKKGMKQHSRHDHPKNEVEPVPEIQGKAKAGHKKANLMFPPR